TEARRIEHFRRAEVPDTLAESIMLRAYERDIVSHHLLPRVLAQWRKPSQEVFADRTLWSLENAFTGVAQLAVRQYERADVSTHRNPKASPFNETQGLFDPAENAVGFPLVPGLDGALEFAFAESETDVEATGERVFFNRCHGGGPASGCL